MLSREFGVTVMTLRQAIGLLEAEGLVVTRHGSGTFVAPRHVSYGLGDLSSFSQQLSLQGLELTTQVLSAGFCHTTTSIATRLAAENSRTFTVERLRLVRGVPVALQRSHLPAPIGSWLADIDLSEHSLYDVLATELGLEVGRAEETLYAISLDARTAQVLEARDRAPAVLSERLTLDADEQPILFDEAYLPGDRVVISAERLAGDVKVRYRLRAAERGAMV